MTEKILTSSFPSRDPLRALSRKQRVIGKEVGSKPQSKKELHRVEPLGRVKVNFVKAYDKRSILKASARNEGDNPELFIDLEHPQPSFTEMDSPELHLGISANFRFEPQRDSSVKPHIDIYVPASEARRLREMLEKVK